MDASLLAWGLVLGTILILLALDLFMHADAHVISVKEAAAWSAIWVTIGLGAGAVIWWAYGAEFGQQYFAGYIIEKSLAVDNVFIWAIIFSYFAVPRRYQHRVLFYGVVGALVLRAGFIAAGSALIASFAWILYVFAAFLVYTGWRMLRTRNAHLDPSKSRTLDLFRRFVPMTQEFRGQKFLIRQVGKWVATPLLAVLVLVEVTDVIFAVDSIPAIFAVTSEPFLVFAANAFAILGLRAMYFLLADLMHRFVYLKTGLALVLIWVGIKMMLVVDVVKIPTTASLVVVSVIIACSIWLSLRKTKGQSSHAPELGAAPFKVCDERGRPLDMNGDLIPEPSRQPGRQSGRLADGSNGDGDESVGLEGSVRT